VTAGICAARSSRILCIAMQQKHSKTKVHLPRDASKWGKAMEWPFNHLKFEGGFHEGGKSYTKPELVRLEVKGLKSTRSKYHISYINVDVECG